MSGVVESFYTNVELISGFIWGGSWGEQEILPVYASPMVVALLGAGFYFMIALRFRPIRRLFPAFGELWSGRKGKGEGEITPWQALSTALSGQVGTGNLAGVATALSLGGPGAIFWMWVTAIFGMALAFAESSLAVRFREKHPDGRFHGGPMYYITNGLGKHWKILAILFCLGTLFSATATGGMIQSNSITQSAQESVDGAFVDSLPCALTNTAEPIYALNEGAEAIATVDDALVFAEGSFTRLSDCDARELGEDATIYSISAFAPTDEQVEANAALTGDLVAATERAVTEIDYVLASWIFGLVLAVLVFAVIIGGIKSIGSVAGKVVPVMALAYVLIALVVLILNIDHVDDAFVQIFSYAFGLEQAVGGAAGYGVVAAIRYGVARGLFSNEAGQGSAPIAHAAAQTNDPVRQGEIASIGVFIDTIVICTMTALVILVVDGSYGAAGAEYAWYQSSGLEASAVTTEAYRQAIPFGNWVVTIAIALFAFTTIIGWSYYAETAVTYLVGDWAARPFRFVWVGVVFIGALQPVNAIWRLGDLANASMALPNIIAIVALSGVVFAMARDANKRKADGASSPSSEGAGE